MPSSGAGSHQLFLRLDADRPHEANELAGDGDDLAGRFALVGKRPVATIQTLLRSPSSSGDFRLERLLKYFLTLATSRAVSVMPSGLDQDASQMRVARLGDRTTATPRATRVLG